MRVFHEKVMEEKSEKPRNRRKSAANRAGTEVKEVKAPQISQTFLAVPFFQFTAPGIMIGQPICAVQSVRPVREQVKVEEQVLDLLPGSQAQVPETSTEATEAASELQSVSSEDSRELWSLPLPVERTFIQFTTRAHVPRRAHSVGA
ncbi:unnamed protein product [Effrenium voratum]|nr:unnamed protein product [Effrenium voratum]